MGLFDTPLPTSASSAEDENSGSRTFQTNQSTPINGNNNSLGASPPSPLTPMKRIFSFRLDGTEKNNFLPPLSRSLDTGLAPRVPLTDANVQTVSVNTHCLPEDAAWALEACQGDLLEASHRISTAQGMILEQTKNTLLSQKTTTSSSLISSNGKVTSAKDKDKDLHSFRERLKQQERERRTREESNNLASGKPDGDWLPLRNPTPVEDEPWFTG